MPNSKFRRQAVLLGLASVLAAWTWTSLTVHYNYDGNWTGLFCIRPGMPVPDFLKSENLYIFRNSEGYDGQVYHLIAHDPWMRKGSVQAIAGASFRYQRIFVPALAWMVALGQDRWVHAAYFAVIFGFVFLGVYWTGQFASRVGRTPTWGLAFLLAPATIISLDRMTADIALAALVVGFALYADKFDWRVATILVCAALTRETALPVIAGYAIYLASQKQVRASLLAAATALPAAGWYVYLSRLERSSAPEYVTWIPLAGFAERIAHPTIYPLSPFRNGLAIAFDYCALAGVAIALVIALRLALQRRWDPRTCAICALALAIVFLGSRSVWEAEYAFGRVFSPFLLLVMLDELPASRLFALLPILLVDLPIPLALWHQVHGVIVGVLSSVTGARP
jgi:hypothetical protein